MRGVSIGTGDCARDCRQAAGGRDEGGYQGRSHSEFRDAYTDRTGDSVSKGGRGRYIHISEMVTGDVTNGPVQALVVRIRDLLSSIYVHLCPNKSGGIVGRPSIVELVSTTLDGDHHIAAP